MIASTKDLIDKRLNNFKKLLQALEKACFRFRTNPTDSIQKISQRYNLTEQDPKCWFEKVLINPTNHISETILDALKSAKLLTDIDKVFNPIDFIHTAYATQ